MIEDKIRRGEAVSLVSDQVKLGSSKSLPMDEASKPQTELMAAKGSYGARPSAMGDMAGHQAAQKQLKELETYRKTAPASEHAAVDQEIADLRQFLEGKK